MGGCETNRDGCEIMYIYSSLVLIFVTEHGWDVELQNLSKLINKNSSQIIP